MTDHETVVDIWSEIHCPWALVCLHRLRTARDELGRAEVVFDPRPWPLEWVNDRGTPRDIVSTETIVLAAEEPALFSAYENDSWPSTFLPAFELVAAARRVGGRRLAEEVDYALRIAFFRDQVDVSIAAGLEHALGLVDLDVPVDVEAIMRTWYTEPVRGDVLAAYEISKGLPIQGSPQVFLPSGRTYHNPGLAEHHWERGIPHLDHRDRARVAEIVLAVGAELPAAAGGQ
jgi:predicted DsbA family dithiol-disulfide isomerase